MSGEGQKSGDLYEESTPIYDEIVEEREESK